MIEAMLSSSFSAGMTMSSFLLRSLPPTPPVPLETETRRLPSPNDRRASESDAQPHRCGSVVGYTNAMGAPTAS